MTLTLLLDLDDTLLENDIEAFLPHYLQAFSELVSPHLDAGVFIDALMAGTRQMTCNRRPFCTLKEVFEDEFYSRTAVDRHLFEELAQEFYSQVFPTLKNLTRPMPGARELVESAFDRKYRLSIATNPLFPQTAIDQRLIWAGLPPDQFPFDHISSYEKYHFTKPDPAYYAEFMGYLRWPVDGVVMVGNDLNLDISPAGDLGIQTFWLTGDGPAPDPEGVVATKSGRIDEVIPWLERTDQDSLKIDFSSPQALLAVLRSTPAVLDGILRNVKPKLWNLHPAEGSWCLTEVLCHLRDVDAEVNLPRVKRVQEEVNPFLPSQDTDSWALARDYHNQDGVQALHQFGITRMKLVEMLSTLSPQGWTSKVRHAIFGPTDLHELIVILAGHDCVHIRQVHEILDVVAQNKS